MSLKEMIRKGRNSNNAIDDYFKNIVEEKKVLELKCSEFLKYLFGEIFLSIFFAKNYTNKHYMYLSIMWSYLIVFVIALPVAILFSNILMIFSKNFFIYWVIMFIIPILFVTLIAFGNLIYVKLLQNYLPDVVVIKEAKARCIFVTEFFNYIYWIFAIFIVAILHFII